MEKVKIGTKVNRLGIQRVQCAEGAKCRVVFIEQDPCVKHVAYDDKVGRSVEVDQDMCLKYGLRPFPTFYYLVAKLNTDLNGEVIGDKFTVEYLQLSENLNNKLANQIQEQGVPKSLALTKVKKTADGKDFSYIEVTPSALDPLADNENLAKKIKDIQKNKEFIDTCWQMIDATTTITKEQYLELLKDPKVKEQRQTANNSQKQQRQIESKDDGYSSEPKNVPGDDFSKVNDFDVNDSDFNEGFGD